jgi:hypothetical protein
MESSLKKKLWLKWLESTSKTFEKHYQHLDESLEKKINDDMIKKSQLIRAQKTLKKIDNYIKNEGFLHMIESLNQSFEYTKKIIDEYIDKRFLKMTENLNQTFENKKEELEKNQKKHNDYQDKEHLEDIQKQISDISKKIKDKILSYQELIKKRALKNLQLNENSYTFQEMQEVYNRKKIYYDEAILTLDKDMTIMINNKNKNFKQESYNAMNEKLIKLTEERRKLKESYQILENYQN